MPFFRNKSAQSFFNKVRYFSGKTPKYVKFAEAKIISPKTFLSSSLFFFNDEPHLSSSFAKAFAKEEARPNLALIDSLSALIRARFSFPSFNCLCKFTISFLMSSNCFSSFSKFFILSRTFLFASMKFFCLTSATHFALKYFSTFCIYIARSGINSD